MRNKIGRFVWSIVWFVFARPLPHYIANKWRLFLLRIFGAKVSWNSIVYPSCRIWAPWNLELNDFSTIGPSVECYNVDRICIGINCTISQKVYLCAACHDISQLNLPLIKAPIFIEDNVWIGAGAFIGKGVTIGQGAVIGATGSVYKDVEPWTVVGGNPAKYIKTRLIN